MQSYNVKQFEGCAIVQNEKKIVEGLVLTTMTTENDAIPKRRRFGFCIMLQL